MHDCDMGPIVLTGPAVNAPAPTDDKPAKPEDCPSPKPEPEPACCCKTYNVALHFH